MDSRCFALIPAAGSGSRAGASQPKQYVLLNGEPMLVHTVRAFLDTPGIAAVRVIFSPDDPWPDSQPARQMLESAGARLRYQAIGGASRAESVRNGLTALCGEARDDDWILVHDAARPCIRPDMVTTLIGQLRDDPVGGLLALPVADTVKRAGMDDRVEATIPRDRLWLAQTPQMFRLGKLVDAYRRAGAVTDEAGAMEACGLLPRLIPGDVRNIKVTYPADFALAEQYLVDSR
jgi:2-C-methyl-D-erythritol 4-phosphate cytidylyltransferase